MNKAKLVQQLMTDEGVKLKPYKDTVGKLTIGVGRNLDDVGITGQEAAFMLDNDIERTVSLLRIAVPWFETLDDARQNVLVNMAFNMGVPGLLKFKNTLGLIQQGSYALAASEMLASKWAAQVGARAERLAEAMRSGQV